MEAFPLRAVAHDERLTITEHLSELRARLLLAQAWAFIAPAIPPAERRAVRPLLILAPAFFAAGAAFAYFVVLTPAVRFLQGFNHGAFDVLVQARAYYRFELMTMLALGG